MTSSAPPPAHSKDSTLARKCQALAGSSSSRRDGGPRAQSSAHGFS